MPEVLSIPVTVSDTLDNLNAIVLALQEAIGVGIVEVVEYLLTPSLEHGQQGSEVS